MAAADQRQLVLDFGHGPALGAEDFLVDASNEAAVALVARWPDWPAPAALVVGPARSGKSHLTEVWRHSSGAAVVAAAALAESAVASLAAAGALAIEDLDAGIACERTLFHLFNLARERRASLLLTSAVAPGDLAIALPDLRSRLRAAVTVEIGAPGDDILRAVLVKHFADRQLVVEPTVISYLVTNMERTMAAAATVVETVDRLALATHRKVSRLLAADALRALRHEPDEG